MLQSLLWDDEVREADFPVLKEDVRVSSAELGMSKSLVENMETDFNANTFGDDDQEQLRQLIDAKIAEGDALDTAATFGEEPDDADRSGDVVDLMEALRQSVERNRSSRGSGSSTVPGSTEGPTKKAAAKKRPAKKAAAKKSSGKASGTSAKKAS